MKNKVQVKIDGVMVTIVGIESEEYMTKVAEYIDKKMAEIKKSDTDSYSVSGNDSCFKCFRNFYENNANN